MFNTLKLYFISHEAHAINFDWFVYADSYDEAKKIWQSVEFVLEFLGDEAEPSAIFYVPADVPDHETARALEWHKDVCES